MTEEQIKFVEECEKRRLVHCGECGRQFDDEEVFKLTQIIHSYEKMLAEGQVVYSRPNFGNNCEVWARTWENGQQDIRRCARLVDIQPIPAAKNPEELNGQKK